MIKHLKYIKKEEIILEVKSIIGLLQIMPPIKMEQMLYGPLLEIMIQYGQRMNMAPL